MTLRLVVDDLEKATRSLSKCREIKIEILRYGVNQLEIEHLIKLLAMELEDRDKMISIANIIDGENESGILLPEE